MAVVLNLMLLARPWNGIMHRIMISTQTRIWKMYSCVPSCAAHVQWVLGKKLGVPWFETIWMHCCLSHFKSLVFFVLVLLNLFFLLCLTLAALPKQTQHFPPRKSSAKMVCMANPTAWAPRNGRLPVGCDHRLQFWTSPYIYYCLYQANLLL